jgi:hypothetical protein
MKKIKIGIDINEILRARWLQFDKFYVQEFGEEGVPEKPYVYDFYNNYTWYDSIETIRELKEPDEIPDDINPIDYELNENGESNADFLLFKKPEEKLVTSIEQFNRFMYQDYLFEIFGSAPIMYRNLDVQFNSLIEKYSNNVEFIILSKENNASIPPTLFFLSKMSCRAKKYVFVDDVKEMWNHVDVLITTDPEILNKKSPFGKEYIKLDRPYNTSCNSGLIKNMIQLNDLNGNKVFEKIINFKNK